MPNNAAKTDAPSVVALVKKGNQVGIHEYTDYKRRY